jgi:hypothetical protein
MTKGELAELRLLADGPQPAYVTHQNRARSGVQSRLSYAHLARFLPIGKLDDMLQGIFPEHAMIEITDAGRAALLVFDASAAPLAEGRAMSGAARRPSRSAAERSRRAGIHVDAQRALDREKRRKTMSPAAKEDFDMRDRPRRR